MKTTMKFWGAVLLVAVSCTPPPPPVAEPTVVEAPRELADDEAFLLAHVTPLGDQASGERLFMGTKVKVLAVEDEAVVVQGGEGEFRVPRGSLAQNIRRAVLKEAAAGWEAATFVGYRPGADDQSVEVVGPSASGDPRTVTLDRSLLSVDVNDVNLVLLWHRARAESDPEVRSSLLSSALAKYSSSAFSSLAQGELDLLTGHTAIETRGSSLIVTADGEALLWSTPEASGDPVGRLSPGDQAQVVEETVQTFEVRGTTARWYKLADPAGWVFGADVHE